jgi:GNAT superfamily N-acetyltransferase
MIEITPATNEEVIKLCHLGRAYQLEYSKHVIVDVAICIKNYTSFIESGLGCMFALKIDGKVVGGIAGVAYPDIHSGIMVAVETFWFVDKEYRGHGIKLLGVFEEWAKDQECEKVALIHLSDSFPDVLEKIYARRGYCLVEKHYVKEIQP